MEEVRERGKDEGRNVERREGSKEWEGRREERMKE